MSETGSDRATLESLQSFFELIAEPMARVESTLDETCRSGYEGVDELLRYVAGYKGKRMRPAMILLAGLACGDLQPEHVRLAAVVELLHTATLIHDDVIDEADVRRRIASVNKRFGNETAILLGDFLFSESFLMAVEFEDREVGRAVSRLCRDLCLGEMLEITHRNDLDLPEDRYFDVIHKKTAILFEVGCGLSARLAGADASVERSLRLFARNLGVAFQVTDDCLDLVGEEGAMGKSLGNDVEHGMTTLPFLHFLRTAPEADRAKFREAFESERTPERGRELLRLLESTGSVAHAYATARKCTDDARDALGVLAPTPYRRALEGVLAFVVQRIC